MSDPRERKEPPDRSESQPGADSRRPWAVPHIVDRGSILDVVRSTSGPVTDGIKIGMMPG